jgi:hypothetical protein
MKRTSLFGARRLAKRRTRDALIETRGNLANAARLLDCSRQNVQQMVSRHHDLKDLCEELMEVNKDDWEDKLHKIGVDQSNPTALLGLLNAHARDRGYARHATDLNVSGTISHEHRHLHLHSEKFREVSDSDLARMLEARRRALAAEDARHAPMIEINPRRPALDLPSCEPADDSDGQG